MNKLISAEQFRQAIDFAMQYIEKNEAEKIIKYTFDNYDRFDGNTRLMVEDTLAQYVRFCLKKEYITINFIDESLMKDVYDCFESDYKLFKAKAAGIECLCGFESNEIEKMFIRHFGIAGLNQLADAISERNGIAYILTAIYVCASEDICDLEVGGIYADLTEKLIDRLFTNDSEKMLDDVKKLLNRNEACVSSALVKYRYLRAYYSVSDRRGYINIKKFISDKMVTIFLEGDSSEKEMFVKETIKSEIDWNLFNILIEKYIQTDIDNVLNGYCCIIENHSQQFCSCMEKMVMLLTARLVESKYDNKITYQHIKKGYEIILKLIKSANLDDVRISKSINSILDIFVCKLSKRYPDFKIDADEKNDLTEFLEKEEFAYLDSEKNAIVKGFLTIFSFEMRRKYKDNDLQQKKYATPYSALDVYKRDDFCDTVAGICCNFWMESEEIPRLASFVSEDDELLFSFLQDVIRKMIVIFGKVEGKTGLRYVVNIIELVLTMEDKLLIDEIPMILAREHINIQKLSKILDSDIEAKEKNKKVGQVLNKVKIKDLMQMKIKLEAYDERYIKSEKKSFFLKLFK